jgi:pilus assembly protein CpaE
MTRILLATNSEQFEQVVREALEYEGALRWWDDDLAAGVDLESLAKELTSTGAGVVSIGPGVRPETAIEIADHIDKIHPEISVIVVGGLDSKLWESALRAGVRDVVSHKADAEEIRQVFWRAAEATILARANLMPDITESAKKAARGRIISVVAPKGGSGKTALSVNVAVALAQRHPSKAAILDLDLLFGDVTNALLLNPEHSIADAIDAPQLDPTLLKVLLTRRQRDLFVLTAPDSPALGEMVTNDLVSSAIDGLSAQFDYVVVDTAAGLSEVTLAAIEKSDDIVFICDMSVAAVRGLHKVMSALHTLEMLREKKRHFVLNRADSKVGISISDVESSVGMPVTVRIPSSRLVPRSMNEGTPLIESAPKSPVARAFVEVAEIFSPLDDSGSAAKARRRRQ